MTPKLFKQIACTKLLPFKSSRNTTIVKVFFISLYSKYDKNTNSIVSVSDFPVCLTGYASCMVFAFFFLLYPIRISEYSRFLVT